MPIELACPTCHRRMHVPDAAAGRQVKCPGCQTPVIVPQAKAAPSMPPARPAPPAAARPASGFQAAPVERWTLLTEDQQQYGPVPRQELDQWLIEGRITPVCQLLREGAPAWQWATEVYPQLAQASSPGPYSSGPAPSDNPFAAFASASPAGGSSATASRSPGMRARRSAQVEYVAYSCFGVVGITSIRFLLELVMANAANVTPRGGPPAAAYAMGATCGIIALVVLMLPYVLAGIGVSGRKQWGRILCLVVAGFSALFGLLAMLLLGLNLSTVSRLLRILPEEYHGRVILGITLTGITMLAFFAQSIGSFAILTSSKYAKEFR
jgi:hypothetical protein